jgi:hypothetical protein
LPNSTGKRTHPGSPRFCDRDDAGRQLFLHESHALGHRLGLRTVGSGPAPARAIARRICARRCACGSCAIGGCPRNGAMPQTDASAPDGEGALPHGEDAATAPTSSGVSATIEGAGRSFAQWLKSWLGTPDRTATAFAAVHIFKDCEDCPDMVRIPARTRAVGADAGDPYADDLERPQRNLRMWPGLAIARVEITNAQLKAAGISRHGDRACPLPADGHADAPAACVTEQEMEADASTGSASTSAVATACHPLRRWSLPRVRALTTIAARTAWVAGLPKWSRSAGRVTFRQRKSSQ